MKEINEFVIFYVEMQFVKLGELSVLFPPKRENIKAEVLVRTIKQFKTLIGNYQFTVITPFQCVNGSATEVPKVAKMFPEVTFVAVLTHTKPKDVKKFIAKSPDNFYVYVTKVVGKTIVVNDFSNRNISFTVDNPSGKNVTLGKTNEFVNAIMPFINERFCVYPFIFGIGMEYPIFANEMLRWFEQQLQLVQWEGIKNIFMVSGTGNTCESMCNALKRLNVNLPVKSVMVGGNIDQSRIAFSNCEFIKTKIPYTTEFSFEHIENAEIREQLVELFAGQNDITVDPYCSKMMYAFDVFKSESDLEECKTLLIYVRNA